MADVLLEYRTLIVAEDGRAYRARACGAEARDKTNRWHGWIEFLPVDGGATLRTARETTQPNETCTVYWSTGLTPTYLEGALERARHRASRSILRLSALPATNINPADQGLSPTKADRRFLKALRIAWDD